MSGKCLSVGIILLFIGVAVVPGVDQTIVKASQDNDLVEVPTEQYQNFCVHNNETSRYPKLLAFIVLILWLKLGRGNWLLDHSIVWIREQMYITHPLLLIRGLLLIWRATGWASFWMFLATILGWNWDIEDFLDPSLSTNIC
jgi:hypothetical protein